MLVVNKLFLYFILVTVTSLYFLLIIGAKYAQAERFNDPDDSCKILVATDAIGMGLNL